MQYVHLYTRYCLKENFNTQLCFHIFFYFLKKFCLVVLKLCHFSYLGTININKTFIMFSRFCPQPAVKQTPHTTTPVLNMDNASWMEYQPKLSQKCMPFLHCFSHLYRQLFLITIYKMQPPVLCFFVILHLSSLVPQSATTVVNRHIFHNFLVDNTKLDGIGYQPKLSQKCILFLHCFSHFYFYRYYSYVIKIYKMQPPQSFCFLILIFFTLALVHQQTSLVHLQYIQYISSSTSSTSALVLQHYLTRRFSSKIAYFS